MNERNKVHVFWEGHNILRNLHLTFVCMYCTVDKSKVEISQNFVAFSEYMNFIISFRKKLKFKCIFEKR